MGVKDRRDREFRRREQEILEAALSLFGGDDWHAVTVEEIAERAEIGKGTVYKHFSSKDEIYARIAVDFVRAEIARVRTIDPAAGVLDRLRAVIRIVWQRAFAPTEIQRVVQYVARPDFRRTVSEATRREFAEVDAEFARVVGAIVHQGIEEGLFARKPIPLLLFPAQAALNGAVQMVWNGCLEGADPEAYLQELCEFLLAGLLRPEQPTARRRRAA